MSFPTPLLKKRFAFRHISGGSGLLGVSEFGISMVDRMKALYFQSPSSQEKDTKLAFRDAFKNLEKLPSEITFTDVRTSKGVFRTYGNGTSVHYQYSGPSLERNRVLLIN